MQYCRLTSLVTTLRVKKIPLLKRLSSLDKLLPYKMKTLWIFGVLFSFTFVCEVLSNSSAPIEKGWGRDVRWTSLEKARKTAIKSGKPAFVLITKSWCGACKVLKPKFAESKTITELSKKFSMVHLEDENEPDDDEFRVDGRYIPRIYFLGIDGKVMKEVYNTKGAYAKDSKFYYGQTSQIVDSMKTVLKKLDIPFDDVEDTETESGMNKLARGFGDNIDWVPYEQGLKDAKESNKRLMLIIHKSWCGACKALKPKLAASEKFAELSKNFVMVNVEDDEEPSGSQFVVDGEYVPRVFFMDPEGKVIEPIWNEGTKYPHTKYYYSNAKQLVKAMERASDVEEKEQEKGKEKQEETRTEEKKDKKPWWLPKEDVQDEKDKSNGFGNHIQWHTYEEGLKLAKESNKVMVLIIHKSTCSSCQNLKPRLANNKELGEMSKKFVMVNVKDGNEPEGQQFRPDGNYVPRILFLDPQGKVMKEIWNEDTNYNHVKYYYQDGEELMESMERVLKKFRKPANDFGWGTSYEWVHIDHAFEVAAEQEVPIMLIIHKSWCSACKAFKKKFAKSELLYRHSENFVMVNIQDDDSKTNKQFDADGAYVPRIYFIDPYTKKIMEDIYNEDPAYAEYKYAYGEVKQLVTSMRKASKKEMKKPAATDRGFGSHITWMQLSDALPKAKETTKPVMLVLHSSWCQHSQALKPKFAKSKQIAELSKDFIMVNLQDEEIPKNKYDIDGAYVPRIVFLDHKGQVQKQITNPNSPVEDAEYFYEDADDIVKAMKKISPAHGLDRGFGKDIEWVTLDQALSEAKESVKPVMVIIHKPWCGACKALKPHIANSTEIHQLSKNFLMVNVEDDEEPKDFKFDVDGKYFPRVYFLDSKGDVLKDVHNTELKYLKFKYAHGSAETVIKSMKMALKKVSSEKTTSSSESSSEPAQKTTETTASTEAASESSIDHGLGKEINWVSLDEGYIQARKSWKPLMLIIHKSWCTACQAFRPKFAKSETIKELSKNFIMVNVEDDFDHNDKRFDFDGAYIPRIFFLNPLGEVMTDIWFTDSIYKENKYYFYDTPPIVGAMKKAMEKVQEMKKIDVRDEL